MKAGLGPALLAALLIVGCRMGADVAAPAIPSPADFGARLARPAPHEWPGTSRDYAEQRYSPLTAIDRSNVASLGLAWYHEFDTDRGQEATPLVVDGRLFVSTAWSKVYAFDAASGRLLWSFDPQVDPASAVRYCCDVVNRGVAAWSGHVFVGALDGRLIALDAATGAVRWSTMTVPPDSYGSITGAPRVVKGKVLIGNSGADFGERGYVTAYDVDSGRQAWRFYTVPGDPSRPFENPVLERAAKTWTGEWWKQGGGGSVWDAMAYDAEADLLYVGVGNGYPHLQSARSPQGGDNLFLSSIVALRPDTGEYVWHYQTTPGETWDFTATQSLVLADLVIDGRPRKVILQAPKNGFFYVLDRLTGELLAADPYVETRWASHVDLATGRPVQNERIRQLPMLNMPSYFGGHNWQPMAFSPQTGLAYFPVTELHYQGPGGLVREGNDASTLGETGAVAAASAAEVKFPQTGSLVAWDPVARKERWRVSHRWPINGGVLATAGGLVFEGSADGDFVAYDAADGRRLWSWEAGNGVLAGPISYAVDGEQYVAVLAGYGGAAGLAYGHASPDRPRLPGRLYVFRLNGTATAPPQTWLPRPALDLEGVAISGDVARGESLYGLHCLRCHGIDADGGILPDLRYSAFVLDAAAFSTVVMDGALSARGMVGFSRSLRAEDAEAIRGYLLSQAARMQRGHD